MNGIVIEEWRPDDAKGLEMLAGILHATVHTGASVSFILPFPLEEARAFWREQVLPGVQQGKRQVFIARDGERLVGTVQLILATPPNQAHRADVAKLLVHPDARRRGIARALMMTLEESAIRLGRTLLVLDTTTGNAAERLYLSLGYLVVGVIPRYSRHPWSPELEATTVFYKELPALDWRI